MKTAKHIEGLLKEIYAKSDMNDEFEGSLKTVMQAVRDRDNELRVHYQPWDEDTDEFEPVPKETATQDPEPSDWEAKYNELKTRYTERFFNGEEMVDNTDDSTTGAEIMRDQNADIKADATPRINDLLVEE